MTEQTTDQWGFEQLYDEIDVDRLDLEPQTLEHDRVEVHAAESAVRVPAAPYETPRQPSFEEIIGLQYRTDLFEDAERERRETMRTITTGTLIVLIIVAFFLGVWAGSNLPDNAFDWSNWSLPISSSLS